MHSDGQTSCRTDHTFACRVGGEITRFTVTVGICISHPCHSNMSPMTGLSLRDLSQLDPCVSPIVLRVGDSKRQFGWVKNYGNSQKISV